MGIVTEVAHLWELNMDGLVLSYQKQGSVEGLILCCGWVDALVWIFGLGANPSKTGLSGSSCSTGLWTCPTAVLQVSASGLG